MRKRLLNPHAIFLWAAWLEHATNYPPKPVPTDKFTDCYQRYLPLPCTLWSPASWSGEHGGQGPTTCRPTTWLPHGPTRTNMLTDIPMPTEPWVPRTTAVPLDMLSFPLEYIVACRASQQELFTHHKRVCAMKHNHISLFITPLPQSLCLTLKTRTSQSVGKPYKLIFVRIALSCQTMPFVIWYQSTNCSRSFLLVPTLIRGPSIGLAYMRLAMGQQPIPVLMTQ